MLEFVKNLEFTVWLTILALIVSCFIALFAFLNWRESKRTLDVVPTNRSILDQIDTIIDKISALNTKILDMEAEKLALTKQRETLEELRNDKIKDQDSKSKRADNIIKNIQYNQPEGK